MNLKLNTLVITNFKGIKSLTINFDAYQTSIFAANEGGKSTLSDAWNWLLHGKNAMDQKDFNIKNTVDTSLNRADHQVEAFCTANGSELILKKVYKEKWQKKRGSEEVEFTGNETLYFFNEVPKAQNEYQALINGLLSESVLKMITNPLFFNSNTNNWGWQKRREVLLAIAGNIGNDEILDQIATLQNKQEIMNLTMILNSGKTIQDYKLQIGAKKKKLRDELDYIPARIDEATRSKPEILDWSAIELAIQNKNAAIATIDAAIADSNLALQAQNDQLSDHQNQIHKLTSRKSEISFGVSNEINTKANNQRLKRSELVNKITDAERSISHAENTIKDLTIYRDNVNTEIVQLREKFKQLNASEIKFDDHDFSCPTCLRAFEAGDIDEKKKTLSDNFYKDKVAKLEQLNKDGGGKTNRLKEIENDIADAQQIINKRTEEKAAAQSELQAFDAAQSREPESLDSILAGNDEYIKVTADLAKLNSAAPQVSKPDNSASILQKQEITAEIDLLKRQLNTKEQISRAESRIQDLINEEKTLSQQLADLERTEFLMEAFDRTKMDIMEARVNGKFKYVTFKLFDRQVNGGESPTCETMYKGVPFSDLNTAGRIWAGMDIINTLSAFYQVTAPIFLDNRESVSDIPETNSQIINLVVSPADKVIRVVAGTQQLAEV